MSDGLSNYDIINNVKGGNMYEIRPESVKTFINDKTIRLPRYQRKQTWNDKKNFELSISLFRGYPLGVTVINKEVVNGEDTKWLIDGRQRRNALMDLEKDPELIYRWAKKYIRFKANDDIETIEALYNEKIEEYLGKDFDEEDDYLDDKDNLEVEEEASEYDNEEDDLGEDNTPPKGLELLKNIIFTVHRMKKHNSGFSRIFDFTGYVENLGYVHIDNGKTALNSVKLKKWIQYYISNAEIISEDSFFEFVDTSHTIKQNVRKKFKKFISENWSKLKHRIELVEQIDKALQESKIGLIELSNTTLVDSQKIFEIINTKGTKLSAVEVLSAKPLWNHKIKNPSQSLYKSAQEFYELIGIKMQDIVRWDVPATFISQLNDNGLIFRSYDVSKGNDLEKKVTLGFKLLSALKVSGISKVAISELTNENIDWEREPFKIIDDLNGSFKALKEIEFFRYLGIYNNSIMDILSDAITLNYVTLIYLDWIKKNRPSPGSKARNQFEKNAFILLDRFVFEYLQQLWRGTSDIRVARNIKSFKNSEDLLEPIEEERWKNLILEMIDQHLINNNSLSTTNIDRSVKTFLRFYSAVKKLHPVFDVEDNFEFDHIIPKAYIDRIHHENKLKWKHNIVNVCLLPKSTNIKKRDRKLNELNESTIIRQVETMTEIPQDKFGEFSNIENFDNFVEYRKNKILEFLDKRKKILNK